MYQVKYPKLFTPIQIRGVTFRNRIASAPIGYDAHRIGDHNAGDFYGSKARGGAAAVTIGETTVDSEHGLPIDSFLALDRPECIAKLALAADAIKKHGAIASLELIHPGRYAIQSFEQGNDIYSAVGGEVHGSLFAANAVGVVAKAATDEEIQNIIDKFAVSAFHGMTAGFNMVTIHAAHGMLISQFMSPVENTRTDKWGGSLENRMRIAIEICKAIKAKCGPSFPIEFRMSGDESYPEGYSIKDGVEIAKIIQNYVDLIHVSTGIHEHPMGFMAMCPSMFHPEQCNLKYAAEIKKNVHIPVAAVGMFNDPDEMEKAIADGQADVIELGRALIADPDLPRKARANKTEDIRKCLRCYTCYSCLATNSLFKCAINPEVGREFESKHTFAQGARKNVLIVGGGIAGMQAALTAADQGHRVLLCEKSDRLGGAILCEEHVAFKHRIAEYLSYQAKHVLNHKNIEVRFHTTVDRAFAEKIAPDAIIAALGSKEIEPTFIKGYDGSNIIPPEEVYKDINKAAENIVIIGGGLVGVELAIYLAQNNRSVTVIEMNPTPNFGSNIVHAAALMGNVAQLGIRMVLGTQVVEVSANGVIGAQGKEQVLFEADTVIHALGRRALIEENAALRFCAPEFYEIGDGNGIGTIAKATCEGHYAALNIGR